MVFFVPLEVAADVRVSGMSEPALLVYYSTEGYASSYKVEDQIGMQ